MGRSKHSFIPRATVVIPGQDLRAKEAEFASTALSWQYGAIKRSFSQVLSFETEFNQKLISDLETGRVLHEQVNVAREAVSDAYLTMLMEAFEEEGYIAVMARILVEACAVKLDDNEDLVATFVFPNHRVADRFQEKVDAVKAAIPSQPWLS